MKPDLQAASVQIFHKLEKFSICLYPQWVPRNVNEYADFLSKQVGTDPDDWEISSGLFKQPERRLVTLQR